MAPLTAQEAALRAAAWSPSIPTHFWLDSVTYLVGQIVVHNGALWIEVNPLGCIDSEPDSSNADWVQVAGVGFDGLMMSTVLDSTQIATLNSVPVDLIAAIAGSLIVSISVVFVFRAPTVGTITGSGATLRLSLNGGANALLTREDMPTGDNLILSAVDVLMFLLVTGPDIAPVAWADVVSKPLVFDASADFVVNGVPATIALLTGGAGYYVGEIVANFSQDTVNVTVTAVDSIGAITAFTANLLGPSDVAVGDSVILVAVSPLAITGVNQGTKTFTVAGSQVSKFPVGGTLLVTGSTGNDGDYTTASATLNAGNTDVVTVEAIPDATVDGDISPGDNASVVVTGVDNDAQLTINTTYRLVAVP